MSDVLCIVAPVPGKYPSVNHTGLNSYRGGGKSPEYHDLFEAVRSAASDEIARVGWECSEYLVHTSLSLYHRTGTFPDSSNLGKCELDALTAAGVWTNDKLARPVHLETEYDPQGEPRVVIIVRRRFPAYVTQAAPLTAAIRKRAARREPIAAAAVTPIVGKVAWCNGVPVSYDETIKKLREHLAKGTRQ